MNAKRYMELLGSLISEYGQVVQWL